MLANRLTTVRLDKLGRLRYWRNSLAFGLTLCFVAGSLGAPINAQSQVHVVATLPGPGVDFTSMQAAVDAASNGDIVLVKPGFYAAGCGIVGKSISLIGDVSGTQRPFVAAFAPLSILGTPQGSHSVIRGIDVFSNAGPGGQTAPAFSALNCLGSVTLEDCSFEMAPAQAPSTAPQAVALSNVDGGVVCARCLFAASHGPDGQGGAGSPPRNGGLGVSVLDTDAHLFECTLIGGNGGNAVAACGGLGCDGARGGAALDIAGLSDVTIAGSSFAPGSGGSGQTGGDAGTCVDGGGSTVGPLAFQDDEFLVAQGGFGIIASGANSLIYSQLYPLIYGLPGLARSCSVESPTRVGDQAPVRFTGVPGDLALVYSARGIAPVNLPFNSSFSYAPLSLQLPVNFTLNTATLDSTGNAQLAITMPAIGGTDALKLVVQALVIGTNGSINLSSASVVVLLDAGF